jgi:glycosyltransferase involved in cell wall biosynthesis
MEPGISICIPTFERPAFLAEALESCIEQSYRPLEIIVSDDSNGEDSEIVVNAFRQRSSITVSYHRNPVPLGQNDNVDNLFRLATQPRLILLHDDDLLLPDAIATLDEPWQRFPDLKLSFGNQTIINDAGIVDVDASFRHNASHHRSADKSGLVADSLRAALLLQIPNDGYLIDTETAREIGYRNYSEVGVYCDKDFSLRLGSFLTAGQMYYIDAPVSQYREGSESISSSPASRKTEHPNAAVLIYESLPALNIPIDLESERRSLLIHLIDKLVKGYAISKRRRKAAQLYLTREYGWRRRFSGRGVYHVALMIEPRLDILRPYNLSAFVVGCRSRSRSFLRRFYSRSMK